MHQSIKSFNPTIANDSLSGIDEKDRRKMLTNDFGSKIKKKQQNAYEAGKIDANAIGALSGVQEAIADAVAKRAAEVGENDEEGKGSSEITRKDLLPPFNEDATTVEDIYPTEGLITKEEWSALNDIVNVAVELSKNEDERKVEKKKPHGVGAYCLEKLEQVGNLGGSGSKHTQLVKKKCRYIMYMSILIRFYNMQTSFRKSAEECAESMSVPAEVIHRLYKDFTQRQDTGDGTVKHLRTKFHTDKLVLHIMTLALTVEDFDLDPTPLANDLKISVPKSFQYFRELGCTTSSGKKRKASKMEETGDDDEGDDESKSPASSGGCARVQLKAPLTFPKLKRKAPARR
jgi:hypothetical protein